MRSAIIELEPLSADVSMGLLLYGAQAIRVAFPSRVWHRPRWVTARHDHPANKMCALIDPACCRLEVALPGLVLCHRLARQIHSGHEVRLVSCRPTNNSSSNGTGRGWKTASEGYNGLNNDVCKCKYATLLYD